MVVFTLDKKKINYKKTLILKMVPATFSLNLTHGKVSSSVIILTFLKYTVIIIFNKYHALLRFLIGCITQHFAT